MSQADRKRSRQTDGRTDGQTDRRIDRETDRDRLTDGQKDNEYDYEVTKGAGQTKRSIELIKIVPKERVMNTSGRSVQELREGGERKTNKQTNPPAIPQPVIVQIVPA